MQIIELKLLRIDIQPELSTAVILSKSLEPKSKIVIKKKPKAPKQEPEPPPKPEPEIELPNLRHSKDGTQAPLVSSLVAIECSMMIYHQDKTEFIRRKREITGIFVDILGIVG